MDAWHSGARYSSSTKTAYVSSGSGLGSPVTQPTVPSTEDGQGTRHMTVYTDAEQLYAYVKALFTLIAEKIPTAADSILASRLVIRLHCTGPDAEITINGRRRPLETTYGPTRLRPTLDIELTAGTLHAIMLGELGLKKALAGGLLRVQGPVWKLKALADLFHQGQELYLQVLEEQGWPKRPEE